MESTINKPNKRASLKARAENLKALWQELGRDPQAFRTLIACTVSMIATGLEPAFLTLSTPEIQSQLRNPESHAPMYIAYAFLLLAVLALVAGTSGDLFGRKLILVGSLAGLTFANVMGMVTFGTPQFVIADVIAAITTIAAVPMNVAIVTLAFPPARRPLAYALLFGLNSVAIITGASLGGLFEMWGIPRASFIPVVIVGILAIRLVLRNVQESRADKGVRRTSVIVNLILLVSIFFFVYLTLVSQELLKSWLPVLVAACAIVLVTVCVRWLRKRVSFFRDVEIYTGRDTGFSMLAGVILFIGNGALFYQLTTFFQDVQGMSAVKAGIAFAPYVVGILIGTTFIPALAIRFGARRINVIGMILMSGGLALLAFLQVDTPFWLLLVPMALAGIGIGIANPARTQVVLSAPPVQLTASAAAVNTAVGQSGYALGVVLSSLLVTSTANSAFLAPLASAGIPEDVLHKIEAAIPSLFAQSASGSYPNLPQIIYDLSLARYEQAFTVGLGRMFLALAITIFVAAVLIYIGMHRKLRLTGSKLRNPNVIANDEPVLSSNDML